MADDDKTLSIELPPPDTLKRIRTIKVVDDGYTIAPNIHGVVESGSGTVAVILISF